MVPFRDTSRFASMRTARRPAALAAVLLSLASLSQAHAQTAASTPAVPSSAAALPPSYVVQRDTPATDGAPMEAASAPTASTGAPSAEGADAPWVLGADQHPWPLHYREPAPLNVLYLDLPTSAEVRLMLPGRAADAADRARFAVSKFFSDVIGSANQVRGSQLEALNSWIERTNKQSQTLSADVWQRYEFSREALSEVTKFRDQVKGQSQPQAERLAEQVRDAVSKIAPLVDLMPTYELRMAWYNILVQLKEGVTLYQTQVGTVDQNLGNTLEQYLSQHPPVPRPEGNPPQRQNPGAQQARSAQAPTLTVAAQQEDNRKPAKAVAVEKAPDSYVGAVLALFAVLTGVWVFFKLRKRNKDLPVPETK